jgi:hypothetical protein
MAWLAEMGRTEAKPESDRAAETTFKFNSFFSMGFALANANSCLFSYARSTD